MHKTSFKTPALIACFLSSAAQGADDSLSLNGFTGLLTVPNAHVTEYGTGMTGYSDTMFLNNEYVHNNNVMGAFGVFPHLEISGRIAWFKTHNNLFVEDGGPRDLSANIKLNIPFIPDNWFDVAVGKQDIGGEVSYFDTTYIAASKSFGPIRFDIGYGNNGANDRLDGGFGGIEFTPYDWISLIAEYDAQDVNTGFRLSTPRSWTPKGFRAELTVMADTSNEPTDNRSFYAVNLKFPLGGGFTGTRPKPAERQAVANNAPTKNTQYPLLLAKGNFHERFSPPSKTITDVPAAPTPPANPATPELQDASVIRKLRTVLVEAGFDHVDTGLREGQLFVAFENNIYNRNELDALAVVLRKVADLGQAADRATVVLRNQRINVIAVEINTRGYLEFLRGQAPAPLRAYYPKPADLAGVQWLQNPQTNQFPKPRITISPILNSGIATEYGVWDYSFGAAINGAIHLWPGALVSTTYTQELDNSEDFDEDGVFRGAKIRDEMQEVSIQQGFKLNHLFYNNLTLGTFRYDYSGFQNETLFNNTSGTHQVKFRFGDYDHDDGSDSKDFRLLSYRYYWPKYDVAINTTAGKFWDGDKGYRVNTLFRFGDQTVELFYKDVEAPISNEKTEFIGIAWTLPLTPHKDWDSKYIQAKGNEAWRWGFQTRINNERNDISFGIADVATSEWSIERTYLNNDKMSPNYLYSNLNRLKQPDKPKPSSRMKKQIFDEGSM